MQQSVGQLSIVWPVPSDLFLPDLKCQGIRFSKASRGFDLLKSQIPGCRNAGADLSDERRQDRFRCFFVLRRIRFLRLKTAFWYIASGFSNVSTALLNRGPFGPGSRTVKFRRQQERGQLPVSYIRQLQQCFREIMNAS